MITIDNAHFEDGWLAYNAQLPIQANPFLYMANPYRLWKAGYECAQMCDLANMGIHHMPEDLHITHDGEGLKRLEKSPFAQGQVAYAKGIAATDFPYGPGTQDAYDWVSGWRWQQNKQPRCEREEKPVEHLAWLARIVAWWRGLWS